MAKKTSNKKTSEKSSKFKAFKVIKCSSDASAVMITLDPGVACELLRREAGTWWEAFGRDPSNEENRDVACAYEEFVRKVQSASNLAQMKANKKMLMLTNKNIRKLKL